MLVTIVIRISFNHLGPAAIDDPPIMQLSVVGVIGNQRSVWMEKVDILGQPVFVAAVFVAISFLFTDETV